MGTNKKVRGLFIAALFIATSCASSTPSSPEARMPDSLNVTHSVYSQSLDSGNTPNRVVCRDDQWQIVTKDYVPGRYNLHVKDGMVTGYSIEGFDTKVGELCQ